MRNFICALSAALLLLSAAAAGAQEKPQTKERRVKITTGDALFDAEKEEVTTDDDVEIQLEGVVLRGKGLRYSRKEEIARFLKGPIRVESSEKGITGIMGNVEVNLEARTARAWGGCVFEMEDAEKIVRMEAEEMTLDEKNKKAEARSGAQFHYRGKPAEKQGGERSEVEKEKEPEIREFHFTSGRLVYDYGRETVVAGGGPKLEFEEGSLTAPEMRADLAKKVVEANDVEMAVNEFTARAGSAVIYYVDEKAELAGGVVAERGGEQLRAEKIEIGYRKGKRYVHLRGKGEMDLIMGGSEKQETGDQGAMGSGEKTEKTQNRARQ